MKHFLPNAVNITAGVDNKIKHKPKEINVVIVVNKMNCTTQ
jgi:hypothetical protein